MSNKMIIKTVSAILSVGIVLASSNTFAANWFKLRGTEPGGTAHTLQMWGFLQPRFVEDKTGAINFDTSALGGGAAITANALQGKTSTAGTIPRERNSQKSFYMRRARIGIRGTMLPINNDIDYFILTEWGQNGVTSGGQNNSSFGDGGAQLLDASVTLNHLSRGLDDSGLQNLGARFRMGQFLFSQTSESLAQSTPGRRVHMFFAEATFNNALRRRTFDNGNGNFPGTTSINGGRDIGFEIFDYAEFGDASSPYEFTYSVALGNGDTIGQQNQDNNFRKYAWLAFGKLFDDTRGPRRHDLMFYGFWQNGDITFNDDIDDANGSDAQNGPNGVNPVKGFASGPPNGAGNNVPFVCSSGGNAVTNWKPGTLCRNGNEKEYEQTYYGYGINYFDKPIKGLGQMRANIEYQEQKGFTFDGAMSPASEFNSGVRKQVEGGLNTGWYADFGYDIHGHWNGLNRTTINLRYDEFDRNKNNADRAVHGEALTFTGEYFFHKKARLTFTYQKRDWDVDRRTKDSNAEIIGNGIVQDVGNRFGLELTFIFKNVLLR